MENNETAICTNNDITHFGIYQMQGFATVVAVLPHFSRNFGIDRSPVQAESINARRKLRICLGTGDKPMSHSKHRAQISE